MDSRALEWHLSILEHGFCVEKEVGEEATLYRLTQEGKVVDYVERSAGSDDVLRGSIPKALRLRWDDQRIEPRTKPPLQSTIIETKYI